MMKTAFVLALGLCFAAVSSAIPIIGGDPIHTEEGSFDTGVWDLDVYSYIYDATSTSLPDLGVSLNPDEMLFVYLLEADDNILFSVPLFSLSNPQDVPINLVGWSDRIVPDDFEADEYQAPDLYGYIGTPGATVWHFSGSQAGGGDFEEDEWSLVFYRAVASNWTHVDANVGAGTGAIQSIPGAIPEPATVAFLTLGGLFLAVRRKKLS